MGKSTGMENPLILFRRTLTGVVNSGKSHHWELATQLGVCTPEIMLRLNQGWKTGRPSSPILIQSAGSSMQVAARRMYGSEHFLIRSMAFADDLDIIIIRIGWPNNALLFDMDRSGSRHVCTVCFLS